MLFDAIFTNRSVCNYRYVMPADAALNAEFYGLLRYNWIFKSAGKTYTSLALTDAHFEQTEGAIDAAARDMVRG